MRFAISLNMIINRKLDVQVEASITSKHLLTKLVPNGLRSTSNLLIATTLYLNPELNNLVSYAIITSSKQNEVNIA